jgi:ArsR family transcriptional regulator, arsenate/arsenite/antimonite-responsive transcriptional repressor
MDTNALAYMESFYTALADKTRLRLLNLMRDEEVCVCFFTEVLGDSQPKISRHLAYLRNSGLVQARRDGKWMHYSIVEPRDEAGKRVLRGALEWLDSRPELKAEREKYKTVCCTPELLVQIARTPITFIADAGTLKEKPQEKSSSRVSERQIRQEPDYAYTREGHNEIEEFLL